MNKKMFLNSPPASLWGQPRLLPGHLAASSLEELHTMMPPGLTLDPVHVVGSPPGCLGWWWG